LLKPGGIVMFTTPHAEDLEQSMTYCPFCEAEYHRVQHVRSFTPETMTELLESHGLEVLFCRGVDFGEFQRYVARPRLADVSLNSVREWLASRRDAGLDRLRPRPFPEGRDFTRRATPGPHLAAVATRA
ncbi:MAG TPA: methyltransferase domain-containing protein, partial [Pyrinomonadaceae bacterium]|nr:methyltransferase domain-containing protein [Pyrinomonadaceae bacterium]